jgi:glutamyl-tRNA synthetase
MGFLPEAVCNYLLRLGWGHGDDEIISREQALEWFDLDHVGRSPSRFDFKKLDNLNGHYIREADDGRLTDLIIAGVAADTGRPLTENDRDLLLRSMAFMKPRAKNLNELRDGAAFLFRTRPLPMDEQAASLLDERGKALLAESRDVLATTDEWSAPVLEAAVRTVAEKAGIGLGKVAQPLRAALTGRTTSPGIFDVLALLGREESLARLEDQIQP